MSSLEGEKYDVLEKIGHGSFGVIRKVRRKNDGLIMCRKEISYLKMSQKEREQLHAEFQILSTLSHPNIVKYYHREHLKQSQDLHFYMEYCGNGDLGRVIRDLSHKNQYAEESFVWSIFAQLVTALYRCHYGVDPPEVGKTILGLGSTAKPKAPTGGMTILHRDLKPENVFLGEDNSVKLGDFGLSKMIQSHDFASTYVGTPFYMSPEICAAEKYTLKSDIWSLGCIIYELCTREPPFNAKSHFQLVQRIKEGKISPLPAIYSAELMAVIKDCLKVNPERRPDTAQLLNLPVVRLMRKEKEVVEFSKMLKVKEDALDKRIRELDHKLNSVEGDKAYIRQEIDSSLRREWEVKARLEIDRLVNQEMENLQKKFEEEVQAEVNTRVDAELAKYTVTKKVSIIENEITEFSSSLAKSDYPFSSIGNGSVDEFPSTTDITELSYDSPEPAPRDLKKNARTPFARAQTMFAAGQGHAGTPMDIEMASPSPITIASLSLSPRRTAATKAPHNPANIFTANQVITGDPRWEATRDSSEGLVSDSDSEDEAHIPSPTRMIKSIKNPFQSKNRPALHATRTAPTGRLLQTKQTLPPPHVKTANNPDLLAVRPQGSSNALRERCSSPNRRLSKIPSATNLNGANNPNSYNNTNSHSSGSDSGSGNPTGIMSRHPSFSKGNTIPEGSGLVSKVGAKAKAAAAAAAAAAASAGATNNNNNGVRGRTLVELQQARAGGRPMSAVLGVGENSIAVGGGQPQSPTKRAFREHFAAGRNGQLDPAPVWDPERDEMPSPFLVRRKAVGRF
ncbi:kinase-like protein [Coniochaeta ligniaria NRRL 30616]|uniref:non-specific serine/threonine protein kinase n=1 Tax=Coniochaeta ligniaria NRRL 30616 TaxID=1408157 RepID=A0A1J7ITC3_9PEZI|nr:kinase-like protein [Coniochaeta ligniaria NRRL 30616]